MNFSAAELLGVLIVSGLLGMVGQGARTVAGLKKMNDLANASAVSQRDLFVASRLIVGMIVGFIAGVAAALTLGVDKLLKFDAANVQLLMGIAASGYIGADFVEAFARNLSGVAPVKIAGLEYKPETETPSPDPGKPEQPARAIPIVGKMSWFGGPDDPGVSPSEGLAFIFPADVERFRDYFLPEQPPGTTGLARRLNPEKFYIACRWNYRITPAEFLKKTQVQVTNPANGRSAMAQPMDWGPGIQTGRTADLSPGLARHLGLVTDQVCNVLLPLPADAVIPSPGDPQQLPMPEMPGAPLRVMRSESDIRNNFGSFQHVEARGGAIRIVGNWASQNITTVTIPEIARWAPGGKIQCHRAIGPALVAAFAEVTRRGLADLILTYDGCWVPRHMGWDPSRSLSRHSWGIAFDINVNWNGYGVAPAPKGARGSVVELVPIFESFGFAWGGYFRPDSLRDGMHFEFCKPVA